MSLTIAQAFEQFNENIRPLISADDLVAMREAWNDYTDELTKERNGLNSLQYHYCPAVDDDMPEDDLEFILDAMGVKFKATQIDSRPDGLMTDTARHFKCAVSRGSHRFTVYFSQGSAHTQAPDMIDVLQCLFMDATEETFEDWCRDLGYSDDSRAAEKIWKACLATDKKLAKLFSKQEREDLAEMLGDR